MFYVAYFKDGAPSPSRPVMFLYNGGPGSATVWLHMGAFGPRRVLTAGDQHLPAAPYALVENEWSLLDATDVVFIDAPGAGFSRIAGPDKEKSFYGVDARRARVRRVHHPVPRQVRPLELAQVPLRRELRHDPLRRPRRRAGGEAGRSIFNGVVLLSQFLDATAGDSSSRRRPRVRGRPPDVRRDRLVPPQARRRRPDGSEGAGGGGGALRAHRVRPGAPAGQRAPGGRARGDRREAPQVHRAPGRLHPQGEAPGDQGGVREGAPGRPRT